MSPGGDKSLGDKRAITGAIVGPSRLSQRCLRKLGMARERALQRVQVRKLEIFQRYSRLSLEDFLDKTRY